jgi:hypothetical protein
MKPLPITNNPTGKISPPKPLLNNGQPFIETLALVRNPQVTVTQLNPSYTLRYFRTH